MTVLEDDRQDVPMLRLRVYRHGRLIATELCSSEEDASLAADWWLELEGVRCDVPDRCMVVAQAPARP